MVPTPHQRNRIRHPLQLRRGRNLGRCQRTLLTRLGIGSVRDEAWAALENLKKRAKDIVEFAGEAEKLAKRLHPRDEEAAERHAVDAFLGALDKTLKVKG